MDLISIIVPLYNTSKYLEKCLNSIKNQTYKNIEIIIVDDGSTDSSLQLAKKIALEDKRMKVYHKKNGGLSSARNYGIQNAQGKYISFVDSDDYIASNMIEILYKNLIRNSADISICGWYLDSNRGIRPCDFKTKCVTLNNIEATNMLLNHVSFDNFACNKLFLKDLFNEILFPEGKILEDLLTIYKLIYNSKKIVVDSTPLYYYVLHENSITSNLYKQIDVGAFQAFQKRKDDLCKMYPSLDKKIKSNFFTACKSYFIIAIKSSKRDNKFEKERIIDMRKYIKYIYVDKSIPIRVKISSTLITIFPYLYFKVIK